MPPYFEDAAHLLCFMVRVGLVIDPAADCRALIYKVAAHIHDFRADQPSHATAAAQLLAELEKNKHVKCNPARRAKVLAVIGTTLGNYPSMPPVRKSPQEFDFVSSMRNGFFGRR